MNVKKYMKLKDVIDERYEVDHELDLEDYDNMNHTGDDVIFVSLYEAILHDMGALNLDNIEDWLRRKKNIRIIEKFASILPEGIRLTKKGNLKLLAEDIEIPKGFRLTKKGNLKLIL